jgi:DNA repair protein RadD
MSARAYQTEMIDKVVAAFAGGVGRVCLQAGTGSGKTFIGAEILQRCVAKGYRAAFFCHLDSLIDDTHERLTTAGVYAGFVQAGRPSDPLAPVQVCSLGTLHSRGETPPAQLIILDEAHRCMAVTVRAILARYPEAVVLGLTATPARSDGQPLGDIFNAMIQGPSNRWLTDHGYLVPCDVIAPGSGPTDRLAEEPWIAYERHAAGTRAIVFARDIAHAQQIRANIPGAELLIGETPRAARQSIRRRLRDGSLRVVVGVGVFIEGWDSPEVETIVLARGFSAAGPFLQSIGRGLRPSPGKERCLVVDLRGSAYTFGLPDEDRTWSLTGASVVRTEAIVAIQKCRACLAIFKPSATCPRCGSATHAERIPRVLTRAEKLVNLSALPQHVRDARYLAQLLWVAQSRVGLHGERAEAWARRQFRQRFSRAPQLEAQRESA